MSNVTVTVPTFTVSERRTLLRLLDLEWSRVNQERIQATPSLSIYARAHLNDTALLYLQDLESLQRKLS